ncbi:hypothetical protein SVIOM74S_09814 [Streptomyces violarus]
MSGTNPYLRVHPVLRGLHLGNRSRTTHRVSRWSPRGCLALDDPQDPTHNRFTGKRFEKALNVTLSSVIFCSSGQDLTTTGTYIEVGSRLLEPALLALAATNGHLRCDLGNLGSTLSA